MNVTVLLWHEKKYIRASRLAWAASSTKVRRVQVWATSLNFLLWDVFKTTECKIEIPWLSIALTYID